MRTIERSGAGVLVVTLDRKILVGKKRQNHNGPYSGMRVFPGGFRQAGESAMAACFRETYTETRLNLLPHPVELLDDDVHDTAEVVLQSGETVEYKMAFAMYLARLNLLAREVIVRPGVELPRLEWPHLDDVPELDMPEPSYGLIERAHLLVS